MLTPVKEESSLSGEACSMEVSEGTPRGGCDADGDEADQATSAPPPEEGKAPAAAAEASPAPAPASAPAPAPAEAGDDDFAFLFNSSKPPAKKGGKRRRKLGSNLALQTSPDEKENHGGNPGWKGDRAEPRLTRRTSGIQELHNMLFPK